MEALRAALQHGTVSAISDKRSDIMVLMLDSDGFETINKEAVEKNAATLMPLLELFEFSLSSLAGKKEMTAVLADLDKASGYALTVEMELKGQKGLYYDYEVQKLLAGIRYAIKLCRRTEEVKVKDSESLAMKELKRKYFAAMEKAKSKPAVPIIEINEDDDDDDDDEPLVVTPPRVVTPPPSVATPRPLSAHQQQLLQQMLSALSSGLAAPPLASVAASVAAQVAQPVVRRLLRSLSECDADTTTVDNTQIIDADSFSASATAPTAPATPPPLAAHRLYGKQKTLETSPLQPPCSATLRQCEHAPTVDHSLQRKDAKTQPAPKKGAAAKTKAARKKGAAAKMKAARNTGAVSKEKAAPKQRPRCREPHR